MRPSRLFALASIVALTAPARPAAATGYDHVLPVAADRAPVSLRVGPGDTMTWLSLINASVWVEFQRKDRLPVCADGRRSVRMALPAGSTVKSCWLQAGIYEYRVLEAKPGPDQQARLEAIRLLLANTSTRPPSEQARAEEHERVLARREAARRETSRPHHSAAIGTSLLGAQ